MSAQNPLAKPSITNFKQAVDGELKRLTDEAIEGARAIDEAYAELLGVMQGTLLSGGKRLRPYLSHLAYVGLGGKDPEAFVSVAASQELLHHFLLMHDDIIDRDFTRHGVLNVEGTYHERFLQRGFSSGEALHYAESFALMAGDAACALGLQAITQSTFTANRKLQALACVQRMLFEIMGGEFMDVDNALSDQPSSIERLLSICHYKTATYSFQTPLQLGSILSGARPPVHDQLRRFGHSLGIAFQLADDQLGMFGDEAKLGKPVVSDLREGKQTLLIYYAYELATPAQSRTLRRLWGNAEAGMAELAEVRQIVRDCGAQAKTTKQASMHLQDSLAILKDIPLLPPTRQEIEWIAHFCVNREY
jgi:geranylgeranyl diphosphate synthase, type II